MSQVSKKASDYISSVKKLQDEISKLQLEKRVSLTKIKKLDEEIQSAETKIHQLKKNLELELFGELK